MTTTTNTLTSKKINSMIERVLDGLELNYEFTNRTNDISYFTLDFEKPMTYEEDIRFTMIITARETTQNISVLVTDIKNLKINKTSEDFNIKLNFLNTSTLYGTVYYLIDKENQETHVNYRHAFNVDENFETLINNISSSIDYIDFFILEIKNILSEDFSLESER